MERFDTNMEPGNLEDPARKKRAHILFDNSEDMVTITTEGTSTGQPTDPGAPVSVRTEFVAENLHIRRSGQLTTFRVALILLVCVVYIYGMLWLSSNHLVAVLTTAVVFAVLVFFILFVLHTPGKFPRTLRSIVNSIPLVQSVLRTTAVNNTSTEV